MIPRGEISLVIAADYTIVRTPNWRGFRAAKRDVYGKRLGYASIRYAA